MKKQFTVVLFFEGETAADYTSEDLVHSLKDDFRSEGLTVAVEGIYEGLNSMEPQCSSDAISSLSDVSHLRRLNK